MYMKNIIKALGVIFLTVLFGTCNNYFHELLPPDDALILSFYVDGQLGSALIHGNTVTAIVAKGTPVNSLVPQITVSKKATLIPITLDYVRAAFPSADLASAAMKLYRASDIFSAIREQIKENPDFNVPTLTIPIDFTGPVTMFVMGGLGSTRQYTVNVVEDSGEPRLLNIRFSKYDNPELVNDALCVVNEASATVIASAMYPVEMSYLSYALVPSFEILGDGIEIGGIPVVSGVTAVQFTQALGMQTKTITVTRGGETKDYTLRIIFSEDPETRRSITDFRFTKEKNPDISVNAVGSIINTDNTGTITVQVFYSGAKPTTLKPSFVSPGTVSAGGITQTSGVNSNDFSLPVEYRVLSRNGMYGRIYTVKVEFINIENNTPHITSFRFSAALNAELVQDAVGRISDGAIFIEAYYGGSTAPAAITPEFSAEGIVSVYGSVQVSGASAQDFTWQVKYTVTNPEYPALTLDYWVQCRMIHDPSSDAKITAFGFFAADNAGLADDIIAKIDQINGKITVNAPIGSGVTKKTMYPQFTAAGQVNITGTPQVSGESGQIFNTPVTYTVVSANGKNTRDYVVSVRELQTTIYVNCNAYGYGDGTSWENAFFSLKAACEAAAQFPQDVQKEIWIAAGTYKPGTKENDYFPIIANTSYLGGFAGYETAKSQRNVAANTVTLSGDLGGGVKAQRLFYAPASVNGDLLFEYLTFTNGGGLSLSLSASANLEISDSNFNHITDNEAILVNEGNNTVIKHVNINDVQNKDAISFVSSKNVIIDHVNIDGVTKGRGIYISSGAAMISDSTIRNCKVTGDGGGICANYSNSMRKISNTTIEKVEASSYGGGIYVYGNSVEISGCTIKNAKARNGGGIYIQGHFSYNTEISNTTIENAEASSYGGGIYNYYYNLKINNCTIKNAKAQYGGGAYFIGGDITMNGGTISNNTATTSGGGVMMNGGDNGSTFKMNSGTISGNAASSQGGGVFLRGVEHGFATFKMNSGTISDNTASQGGGVYCNGVYQSGRDTLGHFEMIGGTIYGNTASSQGGGVFVDRNNGVFIKTGGTIYGSDGGINSNIASLGAAAYRYASSAQYIQSINTTLSSTDNLSWQP
jgi:hypothetical protein